MKVFNKNLYRNLKTSQFIGKFKTKINLKFYSTINSNNNEDEIYKNDISTNNIEKTDSISHFLESNDIKLDNKGEYIVAKMTDSFHTSQKIFNYGLIAPATVFFGYKFALNLIMLHPFRATFWGVVFLTSGIGLYQFNSNSSQIIDRLILSKDIDTNKYYIKIKNNGGGNITKQDIDSISAKPNIPSYKTGFDRSKLFYSLIIDQKEYRMPRDYLEITNKPLFDMIINAKLKN